MSTLLPTRIKIASLKLLWMSEIHIRSKSRKVWALQADVWEKRFDLLCDFIDEQDALWPSIEDPSHWVIPLLAAAVPKLELIEHFPVNSACYRGELCSYSHFMVITEGVWSNPLNDAWLAHAWVANEYQFERLIELNALERRGVAIDVTRIVEVVEVNWLRSGVLLAKGRQVIIPSLVILRIFIISRTFHRSFNNIFD